MTTARTTPTTNDCRKPTAKQLRYLRELATRCGESFTLPRTASEASREIDRLKTRTRTPRSDIRRERREINRDMATRHGDAARVREDEVSGYGSRATWSTDRPTRNRREQTPAPAAKRPIASDATNPPKELARYTTSTDGQRIIYGQRINGVVRLTDVPAVHCGRRIVVERDLTSMTELEAIVADYLAQANKLDAIPAITTAL